MEKWRRRMENSIEKIKSIEKILGLFLNVGGRYEYEHYDLDTFLGILFLSSFCE
jgi:hypothetical protein